MASMASKFDDGYLKIALPIFSRSSFGFVLSQAYTFPNTLEDLTPAQGKFMVTEQQESDGPTQVSISTGRYSE